MISSRLIEFCCFGLPAALGVGGGGGWIGVGGGWRVPRTHVHMHAYARMHTHAHTHAHTHMVNMIISCKWPPPLGESLGIPYYVICTCACICMHVHMCGGHPLTTTHLHRLTPHLPGGTHRISQNSIALELIKIFQFCLKIWNLWRLAHPQVGVLLGGWVGGWVGWWWGQVKTLKI